MRTQGFEGRLRLRRKGEIRRVLAEGKRKDSPWATIFFLEAEETRAGFTARKALGNAVARNRARRRLREFFRTHRSALPCGWYMFLAKPGTLSADFSDMCSGLLRALSSEDSSSS